MMDIARMLKLIECNSVALDAGGMIEGIIIIRRYVTSELELSEATNRLIDLAAN